MNNKIFTDIYNVDFTKLSIGDQIIILNNNITDNNIEYNDLTIYFLTEKPFNNMYSFKTVKSEFNIDIYNNKAEIENNNSEDVISYLKINNKLVSIINYYENEMESIKKENNTTKELIQSNNKFSYNTTLDFDDYSLMIKINYDFNIVKNCFFKNMKLYMFNDKLNISLELDRKGVRELIDALTLNFDNDEIKNCINHLLIYNCTINELRNNLKLQDIILKTFKDYEQIIIIINNFIYPFYEDTELNLKAYIGQFYSHFSHDINFIIPYEISYSNDKSIKQKINDFKCIAQSLLDFITKESYINIYTGDVLNKDAVVLYHDCEILSLQIRYEEFFYKNINNIFVKIYQYDEITQIKKNNIRNNRNY